MAACKISPFTVRESRKVDFGDMSDEELFLVLKEKIPAVAENMEGVSDSNRETVIAFLRVLWDNPK
jgi:hypothetical protein